MNTISILNAEVKKVNGGYRLVISPPGHLQKFRANFTSIRCLANMVKACEIQKKIITLSPKLSQSEQDEFWEAYNRYKPL